MEITEREFRERFELTPGLYRNRRESSGRREAHYCVFPRRRETLWPRKRSPAGSTRKKRIPDGPGELTRLLARDELYYREVRQQVSVSPQEVAEGTSASAAGALRALSLLWRLRRRCTVCPVTARRSARIFLTIELDSSIDVLRDTATVIWGDADRSRLRRRPMRWPKDRSRRWCRQVRDSIFCISSGSVQAASTGASPLMCWQSV